MLSDTICYIPKSEKTEKVVIMLHGYGSDGNDLISMAPFMGVHLPNTAFYAPDAPEKMNFMSGFKWFDIETEASVSVFSHSDYIERLMERAKNILPIVDDFIDRVCQKHHLNREQVILMGFSQGGLIALMSGILLQPQLAGVIACSAVPVMMNETLLPKDIKSKPPVLLTHGTDDDVVPFVAMQMTQNTLKNIDTVVQTHIVPGMGHNIDQSCVMAMINFIKNLG